MNLPAHVRAVLEGLLSAANGRRAARRLSLEAVEPLLDEARASPHRHAWAHGGEVGDERQWTTVALAVARQDEVVVGVGRARAAQVTPGRAWPELGGWSTFEAAANAARCQQWARRSQEDRLTISTAAGRAPATQDELLRAILDSPGDDALRGVYADLLSSRGEARGEFISLQLTSSRLPPGSAQAAALREREEALLATYGQGWLPGLSSDAVQVELRRGFLHGLTVTDGRLLPQITPVLEHEPLQALALTTSYPQDVARLTQAPWLERLTSLTLQSPQGRGLLDGDDVHALLESRRLQSLRSLRLVRQPIGDVGALVLAANAPQALPRLEVLELQQADFTVTGLTGLARSRWFRRLPHLELDMNELGPGAVEALLSGGPLSRLEGLSLAGNRLGDEGALTLAGLDVPPTARRLVVERNRVGPTGANALLDSAWAQMGRELRLEGNPMGARAKERLLKRRGDRGAP